jgi:ribosomal protein L36
MKKTYKPSKKSAGARIVRRKGKIIVMNPKVKAKQKEHKEMFGNNGQKPANG